MKSSNLLIITLILVEHVTGEIFGSEKWDKVDMKSYKMIYTLRQK